MAFKSIAEGNNHFIIHGYSVNREYYSPDYSRNDNLVTTPDNEPPYIGMDMHPLITVALFTFHFIILTKPKDFVLLLKGLTIKEDYLTRTMFFTSNSFG